MEQLSTASRPTATVTFWIGHVNSGTTLVENKSSAVVKTLTEINTMCHLNSY